MTRPPWHEPFPLGESDTIEGLRSQRDLAAMTVKQLQDEIGHLRRANRELRESIGAMCQPGPIQRALDNVGE